MTQVSPDFSVSPDVSVVLINALSFKKDTDVSQDVSVGPDVSVGFINALSLTIRHRFIQTFPSVLTLPSE